MQSYKRFASSCFKPKEFHAPDKTNPQSEAATELQVQREGDSSGL